MKTARVIPLVFAAVLAATGAADAADNSAPIASVQVAQAGNAAESGDNRVVTFADLRHTEERINARMDAQGRELSMLREDVSKLQTGMTELRAEVGAQGRAMAEMRSDFRALNNTLLGILAMLLAACVGIFVTGAMRARGHQRAATAVVLFISVVVPAALIFATVALPALAVAL